MKQYKRYYNKDPKIIIARFNSKCHETNQAINKGDECIYYPIGKKVFALNSKHAYDFRMTQMDYDMGYSY